jgi:hypothetical protein
MKLGYPSGSFIACGTILIIAFACIFGFLQFSAYSDGKFPNWIRLGAPEGSYDNLQILDAEIQGQHEDIYVMTGKGKIFLSPFSYPGNWIEVGERPTLRTYYDVEECSAQYDKMASQSRTFPNQRITQCRKFVWNWETFLVETFVVLTEDGEVWKWRYSPDLGKLIQYTIRGIGMGLVVFLITWITYRYAEIRRNSKKVQAA